MAMTLRGSSVQGLRPGPRGRSGNSEGRGRRGLGWAGKRRRRTQAHGPGVDECVAAPASRVPFVSPSSSSH